jgi:hypothetical protein
MKPENFTSEMNSVLSTWSTSFQKPTASDTAVSAIRKIEPIDCDSLLDIFNVITSKMVQAGFAQVDINMMDEVSGFVCGEKAPAKVFRQCAEEGARQRFAARGEA